MGGYFFCIAKIYPVATINKRIALISDISAHPLSGERYRRRIAPAQDVSVTVYYEQPINTNKFSPVAALYPRAFLYRTTISIHNIRRVSVHKCPHVVRRHLHDALARLLRCPRDMRCDDEFGACRSGFSAAIGSDDATSTAA